MKIDNRTIYVESELVDIVYNKAIQKTLKEIRLKNNYSLNQLVNKLNQKVSRQTLSKYETGKSKIRIYMLKQLADIYKITLEEFFTKITANYLIELNCYLKDK